MGGKGLVGGVCGEGALRGVCGGRGSGVGVVEGFSGRGCMWVEGVSGRMLGEPGLRGPLRLKVPLVKGSGGACGRELK